MANSGARQREGDVSALAPREGDPCQCQRLGQPCSVQTSHIDRLKAQRLRQLDDRSLGCGIVATEEQGDGLRPQSSEAHVLCRQRVEPLDDVSAGDRLGHLLGQGSTIGLVRRKQAGADRVGGVQNKGAQQVAEASRHIDGHRAGDGEHDEVHSEYSLCWRRHVCRQLVSEVSS